MAKIRKQKDISVVKHAAYLCALKAGVLHFGHIPVGRVIDNKKNKALINKKVCRKKVKADE